MSEWVNDGRSDMGLTDADWLEGWVRRLEAAEVRPVYMSFLRVHCVAVPKELHARRPIYITIRTERSRGWRWTLRSLCPGGGGSTLSRLA
jgi:hypothetical protein